MSMQQERAPFVVSESGFRVTRIQEQLMRAGSPDVTQRKKQYATDKKKRVKPATKPKPRAIVIEESNGDPEPESPYAEQIRMRNKM